MNSQEEQEDLRESTGKDSSSNNTTHVQQEKGTTISEPEKGTLKPFGSEQKPAAGLEEMITSNGTKETEKEEKTENIPSAQVGCEQEEKTRDEWEEITEHFTSLEFVKVSEKEIATDNMVSNVTKQIQEQAAYPLLALERVETEPTGSTDVNGTPKDSVTPLAQLGAMAKSNQHMQGKCKTSETEEDQENYKNEKGVECDLKEAPEESRSRETQAKAALPDLLHESVKATSKMEESFAEEKAVMINKEDLQAHKTEESEDEEEITDKEKDNDKDEEGSQQTREESCSEGPVIVEVSRDADIRVPHKKHQNILSGVGSKVKHSIAKVKKAITGKSSQSKPPSPK